MLPWYARASQNVSRYLRWWVLTSQTVKTQVCTYIPTYLPNLSRLFVQHTGARGTSGWSICVVILTSARGICDQLIYVSIQLHRYWLMLAVSGFSDITTDWCSRCRLNPAVKYSGSGGIRVVSYMNGFCSRLGRHVGPVSSSGSSSWGRAGHRSGQVTCQGRPQVRAGHRSGQVRCQDRSQVRAAHRSGQVTQLVRSAVRSAGPAIWRSLQLGLAAQLSSSCRHGRSTDRTHHYCLQTIRTRHVEQTIIIQIRKSWTVLVE